MTYSCNNTNNKDNKDNKDYFDNKNTETIDTQMKNDVVKVLDYMKNYFI